MERAEVGRTPSVEHALACAREHLQDRVVLVTGAGGAVGSELCRQIAGHGPARLLLLDHDESRLVAAWLSLATPSPARWDDLLLVDVRDVDALAESVVPAHPDIVIHAAALSDRDLLERHPREAWMTNAVGTRNVLDVAARAGTGLFVTVSSSVAAGESCVLGQTMRMAEDLTAAWARDEPGRYVSVRLGDAAGASDAGLLQDLVRRVLGAVASDLDGCVIGAPAV
ncbi:polysaccharide biosynthesis protein [Ornithinimicrobium pekingense]|uniref:Ketoreductase domain-containing protein n=1 Tax=Ornithinimicrobium pekingense TaxID=384677 RepID=A0ABQ2FAW9_9MICO|nr:polysaccharide biosynthesis protein [Ornithinimicrobium pekingense]GGK71057.1 hypothetical protein GCM10011509_19340 [Ornithinimicrobium pekingense]